MVLAVDAVQRLGPIRSPRPARLERPPLLPRRGGTALAGRGRRTATPLDQQEGWERLRIFGMGIASYDLTDDGYPEVYLTSQADNKLQTLADVADGRPTYDDMALESGVTAHRPFAGDTTLPSTGWHAEFQDVNADSFVDLFVAKGNVEAQPDHAARDPSNLLLGQPDEIGR